MEDPTLVAEAERKWRMYEDPDDDRRMDWIVEES